VTALYPRILNYPCDDDKQRSTLTGSLARVLHHNPPEPVNSRE